MTENMKKFLEIVSQNTELVAKINAADKDTLITIAKELGIELTEADFVQQATELSDDELDVVAGGKECYCAIGGGGSGDDSDKTCACVGSGVGLAKDSADGYKNAGTRCWCALGGWGGDT